MQIGAAAAALRGDAVGEHAHHGVEILALEIAIRIGAAHEVEELVFAVFARRDFRDDLLRRARRADAREYAARSSSPRRTESSSATQSISSSRLAGKMRPFGTPPHGVIGAADALQEHRDAARRAELAHQLDVADVDAELERRRGHHDLE